MLLNTKITRWSPTNNVFPIELAQRHTFLLISDYRYMYVTNSYYEIWIIICGLPVGTGRLQDRDLGVIIIISMNDLGRWNLQTLSILTCTYMYMRIFWSLLWTQGDQMLCSFERLFGWVSKLFSRLYCIKYCGFGIFQYLFNLNTSVGFRFSRILP